MKIAPFLFIIFSFLACSSKTKLENGWIGKKVIDGYIGNHLADRSFDSLGYKVYYLFNRRIYMDSLYTNNRSYPMLETEHFYFADSLSIVRKIVQKKSISKTLRYHIDSISKQREENSEGWQTKTKYHLTIDTIK